MNMFANAIKEGTVFIVRNTSSDRKTIKIFNQKIEYNNTYDLLAIPGVSEEDIRASLLKGLLKKKVKNGEIEIVSSTVNTTTFDEQLSEFLTVAKITTSQKFVNSWILQNKWYIDPVVGNDQNDGYTALTPLKTHKELENRWGHQPIIAQDTTVTFLNHQIDFSDPITINLTIANGAKLSYIGILHTVNSGSLTGVVNRTRSTNTAWQITNSSVSSNNHFTQYVDYLINNTSNNSKLWIESDLGSKNARVSEPFETIVPTGNFIIPTRSTITNGNNYQICSPTKVIFGSINIQSNAGGTADTSLSLTNLWAVKNSDNLNALELLQINFWGSTVHINQCRFDQTIYAAGTGLNINNSNLVKGIFQTGQGVILGGIVRFSTTFNGFFIIDGDPIFTMFPFIRYGHLVMGRVASFGLIGVRLNNGANVFLGQQYYSDEADGYSSGCLWGTVNVGMRLHAGSKLLYRGLVANNFKIDASTADVQMSDHVTDLRAFDDATGTFTNKRSCTFENLAGSIGSGGFAGAAYHMESGTMLGFVES